MHFTAEDAETAEKIQGITTKNTPVEYDNTPMYIAPHDSYMSPPPQETGSQLVIPAKSGGGGREPGSRKNLIILNFYWIPDLARLGGLVRNDGFGELRHSFQREKRFLRS
jgi:hypothetical protein